jgi:hypothetical protein
MCLPDRCFELVKNFNNRFDERLVHRLLNDSAILAALALNDLGSIAGMLVRGPKFAR